MLDLDSEPEDAADPDDLPAEETLSSSPRDTSLVYAEAEVARYLDNASQKVNTTI